MAITGEFGFIGRIGELFASIPSGEIEGIGDDCAVVPCGKGESLVITTDMLTENIHFLRRAAAPRQLGRKSLAVNLSDVAAMGAAPVASLLSIALPAECRGEWAEEFMAGYHSLSAEYGVPLIGGDTTSSDGLITINVVAMGRAQDSHVKRRGAARPGDIIAVSGPLGESAAGLADVLAGRYDTPLACIHHDPRPFVREGEWLGGREEVRAMIDLSDGLASDLVHIMELSSVGAAVDLERIPTPVTLKQALTGGEDYKLLLTVDPSRWETLRQDYLARFGTELVAVGEILAAKEPPGHGHNLGASRGTRAGTEPPRIHWRENGKPSRHDWTGFTHF